MTIYFYVEREKPYGCFSNFSAHGFMLDGFYWATSEHYFQAQKFVGTSHLDKIRQAKTPKDAANMGRDRALPLRSDWEQVKDDVMRKGVLQKFRTHAEIQEILLSTGNEVLVENSPIDYYWGCGKDGTGKNKLGQILMEVRNVLRNQNLQTEVKDREGQMPTFNQYDHYLVLDLEATCCNQGTIQRHEMEIIEIGAVMVEAQELTIIDQFQTFIQPVRNPVLTAFCQSLTSITQEQVDQAPGYGAAIVLLKQWLSKYPNTVFGSWGDYDRNQFQQDSQFHNLPFPIAYPHVNLKQLFSHAQGLSRRYGMAEALKLAGIALEGTHHRGIDDARNIAKLLPFILGRQQLKQPSTV